MSATDKVWSHGQPLQAVKGDHYDPTCGRLYLLPALHRHRLADFLNGSTRPGRHLESCRGHNVSNERTILRATGGCRADGHTNSLGQYHGIGS